jgi:Ig-like domain CHU_C associated/PKD domain/Secretion system C-terminal sorting domain/Fibronectin type III domain
MKKFTKLLQRLTPLLFLSSIASSGWGQSMANYAFTTSTTGSLTDMSSGTTLLLAAATYHDDNPSTVQNIGFNFTFMGTLYDRFSINSNGQMKLGNAVDATAISGGALLGPAAGVAYLMPLTGDNAVKATGRAHYKVTGSSPNRILTVAWDTLVIPYSSIATVTGGSMQARLYETTGVVEYAYGAMYVQGAASSRSIGLSSNNTNFTAGSITSITTTPTYSLGASYATTSFAAASNMTNLYSAADGSRRIFKFTPPPAPPTAPSNLTFTNVGTGVMTLNWTDNSSNEGGFIVQRSTDGIAFTTIASLTPNTTSTIISGLTPATMYQWRVLAAGELGNSAFVSGSQATNACPTAGTYTVGPTGDYATLSAVAGALSGCAITGAFLFELQPNYTAATETFPITFYANAGSSATNTITIRPASSVSSTLTTTGSGSGSQMLHLNGIDYLTLDGRPGGTGTTSKWALANPSTISGIIKLDNDASNNTFKYLTLQNTGATETTAAISFGSVAPVTGSDNNLIDNCTITDGASTPAVGIFASGNTTTLAQANSNNTISNCNISNFFLAGAYSAGIFVTSGNSDWTITGNSLYQTAARTATTGTTHYGINAVSSSANAFTITNNYIGGSAPLAGGAAWNMGGAVASRFIGIQHGSSTTTYSTVQGNVINNIVWASSSAAATTTGIVGGIYTTSGNVNITGNTIGSGTGTGGITVTTSTGGGASVGIASANSGTVNITNNVIGSWTLSGSVATVSQGFLGISATAGTTVTISGNTIGSLTTTNSINSTAATGGLGATRGINIITGGTTYIIANNTIKNINHGFTGATTSNVILGINAAAGAVTITNNVISNLTTAASATGTTSTASVIGISNTSTTAGQIISRNQIYALSNNHASAAVSVIGMHVSTATTGTNEVFSNQIYNLGAISPLAVLMGINASTGLVTYKNNIIRLGYNETGAAITTSAAIFGFNELVGTAGSSYFFNTIYVGGTGVASGTVNTFALKSAQTLSARTFQNNIFANVRSNASGTGKHYAATVAGSAANPAGLALNHNDYFANGTGGFIGLFNALDQATLAAWRTATGQEMNGVNGDPAFVAATAVTPNLHLSVVPTGNPCDGSGVAIASITDDFDGEVRANLSPTDIGADAGIFGSTGIDVGVTALTRPTAVTTCHTAAEPVVVTLSNFSSNPIDLSVNPVTIQTVVSGTITATISTTVNTGTIPVGLSRTVEVGTINTSVTGNYTFVTTTTTAGDVNAANNVHNTTVAVAVPPVLTGSVAITGNITITNNTAYRCAGTSPTVLTTTTGGGILPYTYLWSTGATTAAVSLTPAVTTLYRVTMTDACGTTVIKDTTLNVVNCEYSVVRNENITYNSIMATGNTYTTLTGSDDGYTNNVSLAGSTFKYQGQPVRNFYATSNGLISFDSTTNSTSNGSGTYGFLTTTGKKKVIAPYWSDLVIKGNVSANKDVCMRYKVNGTLGSGTADIIIEWAEMEAFSFAPANLNFQVILHESDNSIDFNYGNMQRYDGSLNTTGTFATTLAIGLNGTIPSGTTYVNHMILQRMNTNYFGLAETRDLTLTPACNSQWKFTPTATYVPLAADPGAPILNDDVAGAITLPVNSTPCTSYCGTYYSSKGATASAGASACAAATPGIADDDVWFQFSASPTIVGHRIVVTPSLDYNAVVQILDEALTPIQCMNTVGAGLSEIANVNLTNNGLYYVRVYDAATGASLSGEFSICVSEFIPPPANDDVAGALNLTINSTCNPTNSVLPTTLGATPSASVPVCSAATPGTADDDVWYKFTTPAQAGLTYTVAVTGISTYNPVLQLFTGTPAALTAVTCLNGTNNGGTENYTAILPANATYFVRVYHSGPGGANGNFNVCVTVAPPVCAVYAGETPANNASVATSTATMRWRASAGASGYDVYYGTSNPVTTLISTNQPDTFYTTPALSPLTVYYWKVVPRNLIGENATCGQQSFHTNPPACIAAPSLPSNAGTICNTANLSWAASLGASGYDVYLDAGTGAPTTLVSANQASITYTATGLTSGNYTWKVVPKNANGIAASCTFWAFRLDAPSVATTTDSSRCGIGSVNLRATAAGGYVNWYSAATGGTALGTGNVFATPSISATTTYYAGVTSSDSTIRNMAPVNDLPANLGSISGFGQYFASPDPVIISTVDVYPATVGSLTIQLKNAASVVVDSRVFTITAADVSTTVKKTLPLHFNIPAGTTGWQLYYVETMNRGSGAYVYPYNAAGSNFAITGNTFNGNNITTANQMFFYNWAITERCSSPRLPVIATVTPAPVLTVSAATTTTCAGVLSNPITVSSTIANFDTYTWSPATGVTGTTTAQFNPTQTGVYTLTATNNTSRCANAATVNVTVNPLPLAPITGLGTPEICVGNVQTLESRPAPATGVIGTGTASNTGSTPYKGYWGGSKAQYLITAAELTAMGCLPNSNITAMGLNINAFASPYTYTDFTIALKNTTTTQLTATIETGVTTVLPASAYVLTGTAPFASNHTFATPFVWDGTSNLLVETCFNNNNGGGLITNSADVVSTSTGTNVYAAYYSSDNNATVCSSPATATTTTVRPNLTFTFTKAPIAYTWTPLTNLYTDAAATTAYTGTPVLKVYAKPATTSTFTASITDANSCTNTSSKTVVVQPLPTATFTGITSICSGESTSVTANGSAAGSTYAWSTGTNAATTAISTAGTYQVTVTSPAGCVGTSSVTVSTATRPTAAVANNRPTTFCAGDSTVLTATGGDTYAWSTGAASATITARTSGTYKVIVTNAAGCKDSSTVTVTANARPTAAIANSRPLAFCSGDSTVLTASGVGTYAWSTGATSTAITARTSGTYKVVVTNASGCADSSTVTVTANARPTAAIANNRPTTFCAGDSTVLTASGVGTYAWSTGAASAAITARTSGTYKVIVTSGAGCTDSAMVSVTANARPTAAIANSRPTTFCAGDSTVLTANGGGTYVWSTGVTSTAITARTTGSYKVVVTNAAGCVDSTAVTVTSNARPTAAVTGTTTICAGDSSIFAATGGETYLWSTAATTANITVKTAGTYKVTVTNAAGCVDSTTRTLVVNARPTAGLSVSGVATFCQGDSTILTAAGGATYRWTTPSGTTTTNPVTAKVSGVYKVLVFNALGCSDSSDITITVNPKPTVAFTSTSLGGNATFTNTSTGGNTYLWRFGDTSLVATTMNTTRTYRANGTYTVKLVVTSAAGCRDSITNTIVITRVANEEILAGLKALVYPNPTARNLHIEFQSTTFQFGVTDYISVTDAFGREVHRQAIGGTSVELNTENWASGLYMINAVISNQKIGLSKVVKIDK